MICNPVKMRDGTFAIACSRGRRRVKCLCGSPSNLLCDFLVSKGKTCDKPLCPKCSNKAGPDTDYCLDHPFRPVQGELDLKEVAMSLVRPKKGVR